MPHRGACQRLCLHGNRPRLISPSRGHVRSCSCPCDVPVLLYTAECWNEIHWKEGHNKMNIKILSSSKEIKAAIRDIFSIKNQRRVAVTAFVGDEANAYLSYPQGIELYCWPKAGGTNPAAISDLQTRGVKVYFSDSLHMKLYWSKKGVIITSANLSTNSSKQIEGLRQKAV